MLGHPVWMVVNYDADVEDGMFVGPQQGKVTRASAWIGHGSDLGYCQSAWQPPSRAMGCRTHTYVTVPAHSGHVSAGNGRRRLTSRTGLPRPLAREGGLEGGWVGEKT